MPCYHCAHCLVSTLAGLPFRDGTESLHLQAWRRQPWSAEFKASAATCTTRAGARIKNVMLLMSQQPPQPAGSPSASAAHATKPSARPLSPHTPPRGSTSHSAPASPAVPIPRDASLSPAMLKSVPCSAPGYPDTVLSEVAVLRQVEHPNIVQLQGYEYQPRRGAKLHYSCTLVGDLRSHCRREEQAAGGSSAQAGSPARPVPGPGLELLGEPHAATLLAWLCLRWCCAAIG